MHLRDNDRKVTRFLMVIALPGFGSVLCVSERKFEEEELVTKQLTEDPSFMVFDEDGTVLPFTLGDFMVAKSEGLPVRFNSVFLLRMMPQQDHTVSMSLTGSGSFLGCSKLVIDTEAVSVYTDTPIKNVVQFYLKNVLKEVEGSAGIILPAGLEGKIGRFTITK